MIAPRINDLKQRLPNKDYFSDQYRIMVESMLELIRASPDTKTIDVDPYLARIYEFDLYRYLLQAGIPYEAHWILMRANDMRSPGEFTRDTKKLLVPDQTFLARAKMSMKTVSVIDDF